MPILPSTGLLAVIAALALAPTLAAVRDVTAGTLVIEHPWARATPGGAEIGGGYLTIDNKRSAPDRLVGGSFQVMTTAPVPASTLTGTTETRVYRALWIAAAALGLVFPITGAAILLMLAFDLLVIRTLPPLRRAFA